MLDLVFLIVRLITLGLSVWAFIDCAFRNSAAFPAVDRQTKGAWLIFTGLAAVIIFLFGGISFFGLLAVVLSVYYLVDVRAKVIEVTPKRNKTRY